MIVLKNPMQVITHFILYIVKDLTHPDASKIRLYLCKAINTLTTVQELVEYCTNDFLQIACTVKFNDKRAYPLASLDKERFLNMVYYHKGLELL